MANTTYYYGTGRRKKSVARVRLLSGSGKITVNDRDIGSYFGLETLKIIVRQPLTLTGLSDKIDVVCMDMGNNGPGYTDKMSPWDVWRVAEALNAKVVIPDHFDNWANCYEDPNYLVDIVRRKNKENRPEMKTVILLPGARYTHPDDQNIGRYVYPDWREWINWKKSVEYGPGKI